eukprot:5489944-Prymnesium_polylepis.1
MEPQMVVQMAHVGREGREQEQEQRVAPRRAASAEPHKLVRGGSYSGGGRPRGHRHRRLGARGGGTGSACGRMADGGARAWARSAAACGGGGGERPQVAGGETGGRDAAGHERADG